MKNIIISSVLLVGALIGVYVYVRTSGVQQTSDVINSPEPSATENPSATLTPTKVPNITKVPVPLPSGDGKTTFIDETVPWSLLLADASCELKGEIKFLNSNTYDNQNALFIYKGIDHPARNVFWTVIPQDDISVGPNIFNKIPIPDGESLLGIVLPQNPKYRKYEITAKIQYGRLVDEKGNFVTVGGYVKVFEKQCAGKTTIVLP
ncbi:MAG: hypothetical protein AAB585_01475 [Patescibacteria group bacterium]